MELDRQKVKGTVKLFDCKKGFGFIAPDYGGDDLVFNSSSIKSEGFFSFSQGMLVEFVVVVDDDGQIRAVDVTGLGGCLGKDESPGGVEERNWNDLPGDVLLLIFKKIAAFWIIRSAQFVCRKWLLLSYDPELWRCIDMTRHNDFQGLLVEPIAMEAVDRSRGRLEEFDVKNLMIDEIMHYISVSTSRLKCLRLTSSYLTKDSRRRFSRYPQLEELELSFCLFPSELVGLIGQACPKLKSFKLVKEVWLPACSEEDEEEALDIAKYMRQLRRLKLYGYNLTGVGLLAILDHCTYLEYLDIQRPSDLYLDENLKKKCARIKDFRFSIEENLRVNNDNDPSFLDYEGSYYF